MNSARATLERSRRRRRPGIGEPLRESPSVVAGGLIDSQRAYFHVSDGHALIGRWGRVN